MIFTSLAIGAVGELLKKIGARGLAGSGLILNPDRARKDLKPYSKMAGGMLEDALENRDLSQSVSPEETNEEDSNSCHECDKPI